MPKNTTNTLHKIFAKPTILGKKVIFMSECHSTNDFLVELTRNEHIKEGTVVFTDFQTKGKGQRGNVWFSEKGKNILMSMLLRPSFLECSKQYLINLVASLGIYDLLTNYLPKSDIQIKWPNDIYVNGRKIAGILVEGSVKRGRIDYLVLGVGLNLNQKGFATSDITSVFLELEKEIENVVFLEEMVFFQEKWYLELVKNGEDLIIQKYLERLMGINELRKFEDSDGFFYGVISGIDAYGRLEILVENKKRTYDIKQVKFLE